MGLIENRFPQNPMLNQHVPIKNWNCGGVSHCQTCHFLFIFDFHWFSIFFHPFLVVWNQHIWQLPSSRIVNCPGRPRCTDGNEHTLWQFGAGTISWVGTVGSRVCVCLRCLVIGRKMGINPYRLIEVRTSRAASNTNGDGHCIPLTIAALVHRILLSNITMGLFFVCLVKMQVVSWKLSTRCSKSLIAAPGQLWCAPSLRKWVPGMPLGGVRLTSGVGDG